MKTPNSNRGFTLIELLVVITIIAILAGLAMSAIPGVLEKAQQTKVLSNGKQIGIALRLYSSDHDGNYPLYTDAVLKMPAAISGLTDANTVLATLIPDYLTDENLFGIAKSAWSKPGPDGKITQPADRLKAGENGWAYVAGLSDSSNARWPLLATGFETGTEAEPTYTSDAGKPGGVWQGKKAIVIRCDGSGNPEVTVVQGGGQAATTGAQHRYVKRDDDATQNAFKYDQTVGWLMDSTSMKVLNPIASGGGGGGTGGP
jgi:prepilin-type N-terminal cleavage/methylation domain-containing protein